jgi:hypothetical protein
MSNKKIIQLKSELQTILKNNGGFLTPEKVLEYAKNEKTYLHTQFCWDDNIAGEKYRLLQAGNIIRSVKVHIVDSKNEDRVIKIREYVSLPEDRKNENGYRSVNKVLTDNELRLQYIDSIKEELQSFQNKLKAVSEAAYIKSQAVNVELNKEREKVVKKIENEKPKRAVI